MPFLSVKQKLKLLELVKSGKMSQATYDKWIAETKDTNLPDRVPKWSKYVKVIK